MTRLVAMLLVLFELAPPVLLGADPCVTTIEDPCHGEREGAAHDAAHAGVAPETPHQDLGDAPGHQHACACVCHTPLVLRPAPALLTTTAVAPIVLTHAGVVVAGHPQLLYRPPRSS